MSLATSFRSRESLGLLALAFALGGCWGAYSRTAEAPRVEVVVTHPDSAAVTVPVTAVPTRDSARVVAEPEPEVGELPPALAREFRAAWITPVIGGHIPDWPSRAGLPAAQQQAELRRLLDHAQSIGLNAIVLHVRTAADAFYPSARAPWTAFLSGQSGVSPGYDPLAFAIQEAHARGLQLHAWFNPFRAILPNFAGRAAGNHVTRTNPGWIRKYGSQTWIDPGDPSARAAVLADIMEVVERYDIDGVHIDDYFYPYREQETITRRVRGRNVRQTRDIAFPDDATWTRYGAGRGFADRPSWRRANVDDFVERLYGGVKTRKPWVSVGISPFGIWRSGVPTGVTGLDAYGEIYADARRWLREGWVDYMAPQLYWTLNGVQSRFTRLDAWWRSENPHGRHIWPGLFTARAVMPRDQWSFDEIPTQISRIREWRDRSDDVPGHIHFRLGALAANGGALGGRLRTTLYAEPALVPAAPWLGGRRPSAPRLHWTPRQTLEVTAGDSTTVAWWLVQTRIATGRWTAQLFRGADSASFDRATLGATNGSRVAITAIDRIGQASAPAIADLH